MLFFDLLKLLEKAHLCFQRQVFPLFLKIVWHMMKGFPHIFFDLLHIMYRMLVKIYQNLKVQL